LIGVDLLLPDERPLCPRKRHKSGWPVCQRLHNLALLLAHGFSSSVVAELITAGLATAKSERMRAGQQNLDVTRVRISDAGRALS
jgi:hypothetical protein